MGFNKKQEQVINTLDGPVIAISCPGSGKTTVIVERIHNLIESGVEPHHILVITFTKAAADEMQARYVAKYGYTYVKFATIHSICLFILAKAYNNDSFHNNLIKDGEQRQTIQQLLHAEMKRNDLNALTDAVINEISYVKNRGISIRKYVSINIDEPEKFRTVYKEYEQYKKKRNLLDFDDILIMCKKVLEKYPSVLEFWQNMYTHIMIDEYQDTNAIQAEIFYMIAGDKKNICVVGDDDQSIYGFRAADSSIMLNFDKKYPDCKKIFMDTNYRSCADVIKYADNLIKNNKARFEKNFEVGRTDLSGKVEWEMLSSADTLKKITTELKRAMDNGKNLSEYAILYRKNSQAAPYISRLSKLGIPFDISDTSDDVHNSTIFFDIRTYYNLSKGDGQFGDFAKVINKPTRYATQKDFIKIKGLNRKEIMKVIDDYPDDWRRQRLRSQVRTLINDIEKMGELSTPKEFFSFLEFELNYTTWLKEWCDFTGSVYSDMLEIYKTLKDEAIQHNTMNEWFEETELLKQILLEKKKKKKDEDEIPSVKLTTFHSSKGLEWDTVYIINANEGSTPSNKAETEEELEEERRMFYVAMTRAKCNLKIFSENVHDISRFVLECQNQKAVI